MLRTMEGDGRGVRLLTAPDMPKRRGLLGQPPMGLRTPRRPEDELDALIPALAARQREVTSRAGGQDPDRIRALRELTIRDFIPIFVELVEKYAASGFIMQMDASNFLEGGRELRFEFGVGDHRMELLGTVTTEAIAFHETRHSPDVHGELVSGPMLRLHNLDGDAFRNFVCDRLMVLVRAAMRQR